MDATNFLDQGNTIAVEEMWDTLIDYLENVNGQI